MKFIEGNICASEDSPPAFVKFPPCAGMAIVSRDDTDFRAIVDSTLVKERLNHCCDFS